MAGESFLTAEQIERDIERIEREKPEAVIAGEHIAQIKKLLRLLKEARECNERLFAVIYDLLGVEQGEAPAAGRSVKVE